MTDIFHNILLDDDERDGYDTHSKTIPLKEYENLMEQQNKLQSIINLMVKKIKLQDLQLKNLQKELQKPRIDVSKLSTVSFFNVCLVYFKLIPRDTVFRNKEK